MSPNYRFSHDSEGNPVPAFEPPFELLGELIEAEVGDNLMAASQYSQVAASVLSGEQQGMQANGNAFEINIMPDHVCLTSFENQSRQLKLDTKEFADAINAWMEFLLEGRPAIREILTVLCLEDPLAAVEKIESAVSTLKNSPETLRDNDCELIVPAFSLTMQAEKFQATEACIDILLKLNERFPSGWAGGYLFSIAETMRQLQKQYKVSELLRGAIAWSLKTMDLESIDCRRQLFQICNIYGSCLATAGSKSILVSVLDELAISSKHYNELSLELYRATGTYNDFLRAFGAADLLSGLQGMLSAAGGGDALQSTLSAMTADLQGPQESVPLETKVRCRIPGNKDAESILDRMMVQQTKVKSLLSSISLKDQESEGELFAAIDALGKNLLAAIELLKPKAEDDVDMSPPSVTYKQFAVDPHVVSDTIIANAGKENPRPGSPNAEPIIIWGQAKSPKMRIPCPEMATQISAIGGNYIMNFHSDQSTAIKIYIDELEYAFSEKPHFIVQCLNELASVYELENRLDCVDFFKNRLSRYKKIDSVEDDHADLKKRGITLYIPAKNATQAKALYQALSHGLSYGGVDYSRAECNEYQSHVSQPGIEFLTVTVQAKNMVPILQLFDRIASEHSVPAGTILWQDGHEEEWKKELQVKS